MKSRKAKDNAIKLLRNKLTMNQTEFWKCVGVTQSGGSRYETGRVIPKPVRLLLELAYGSPPPKAILKKLRKWENHKR